MPEHEADEDATLYRDATEKGYGFFAGMAALLGELFSKDYDPPAWPAAAKSYHGHIVRLLKRFENRSDDDANAEALSIELRSQEFACDYYELKTSRQAHADNLHKIAHGEQPATKNPHQVKRLNTVLTEMVASKAEVERFVPLPFPSLSQWLDGGLRAGELTILAARTRVGKSAMAVEMAVHAAKHGHPTLIVSREMRNVAHARRMVAQVGRVPASLLRTGDCRPETWERAVDAMQFLSGLEVYMTERARSVKEIGESVRLVPKCQFLIVDYLQLLHANGVPEGRFRIEAVSRGLKELALSLSIPVLALCSVSRPPKERGKSRDDRPTLHDLRESGAIESDADIVLILHRKVNGTESERCIAECHIDKSREGSDGRCAMLEFRPEFVVFEEQPVDQPDFFGT